MKLKQVLELGVGIPMTYKQWKKEMQKRGYDWPEVEDLEESKPFEFHYRDKKVGEKKNWMNVAQHILVHTDAHLNASHVKSEVKKAGEIFGLVEVDPKKLKVHGKAEVQKALAAGAEVQEGLPIVIDADGNILDGRHRVLTAITKGKKVKAYAPIYK